MHFLEMHFRSPKMHFPQMQTDRWPLSMRTRCTLPEKTVWKFQLNIAIYTVCFEFRLINCVSFGVNFDCFLSFSSWFSDLSPFWFSFSQFSEVKWASWPTQCYRFFCCFQISFCSSAVQFEFNLVFCFLCSFLFCVLISICKLCHLNCESSSTSLSKNPLLPNRLPCNPLIVRTQKAANQTKFKSNTVSNLVNTELANWIHWSDQLPETESKRWEMTLARTKTEKTRFNPSLSTTQ